MKIKETAKNKVENPKKATRTLPTFPVVGIGASAGGLDAFKSLIKAIPENAGVAWVLVQHQHPDFESKLTGLLTKITELPVVEISNDLLLQQDHIYVIPANKMLTVKAGKLKLSPRSAKNKTEGSHSIDKFFTSLAEAYQTNAVGVVLSGTATDGTKGLKAIKDQGGITLVQSVSTAAYRGMPESAIEAGVVDFILPAEKIPKKIVEIKKLLSHNDILESTNTNSEEEEKTFKEILSILHHQKGMDFTYYKQSTIRRRILRRMVLNKFKKIGEYATFLKHNAAEVLALYHDMLIPVTSFFRNAKVFENLCESVFPNLIKNKSSEGVIRIWIAGCSTGEEAYSIAICFKEYLGVKKEKVQIFATDLSEPAILKARAGIYSKSEAKAVSPQRLKQYFTYTNGAYQVKKDLRDMCVFAVHNFLKDPPFSKIDFISCRNVLIYMDTYLQKKALSTFHYALNPKGLLMLGKSENTIGVSDLFLPASKTDKIFIRKNVPSGISPVAPKIPENKQWLDKKTTKLEPLRTDFQKTADELLLTRYTPATVVVNEAMEIVYFRGKTNTYLQQLSGKPTHNLLKLAKEGLAFELRNILHKSRKIKKAVKKENIPVVRNKKNQLVSIEAIPLANTVDPHWVIIFEEQATFEKKNNKKKPILSKVSNEDILRLHQLEEELQQLREDMRSISEEQEASNEELQSTNEELLSSNEELQSLNEELETSKEELQSTVEELTVVNQEMINLNEQLATEKEYAEAIIATIPQSMLVLDKNLRVTVANQQFYETFAVNESSTTGRTVYDIGNKQWDIPELRILLEAILPEKQSFYGFEVEHTFQTLGKRTLRMNGREIIRDKEDRLILLSIEDITQFKNAAKKIEESEKQYRQLANTLPHLIWKTDASGKGVFSSERWEEFTGVDPKNMESFEKIVHPDDLEDIIKVWTACLNNGTTYKHEVRIRNKNGKYHWFHVHGEPIRNEQGIIENWIGAFSDITELKEAEKLLVENEERFRNLADNISQFAWMADGSGKRYWYNKRWYDYTGFTREEMLDWGWKKVHHPDHIDRVMKSIQHSWATGEIWQETFPLRSKDGNYRWFLSKAIPIKDEAGKVVKWFGTNTDITELKESEKALNEWQERLKLATLTSGVGIWEWNVLTNEIRWDEQMFKIYGITPTPDSVVDYPTWKNAVVPEDIEEQEKILQHTISNQTSSKRSFKIHRVVDGELRYIDASEIVRTNEKGEVEWIVGTNIDITNQRELDAKLSSTIRQLSLYEKVVTNTKEAVLITEAEPIDMPGPKILYVNEAFCEMTGYSRQEAIGQSPRILQGPKTDRKQLDKIRKALKNWESVKVELINYKKNGEEFYVEFEIVPVADENGWYTHWVSVQRDVTDRKKTEKELLQLATHLELSTTSAGVGTWLYNLEKGTLEWSGLHKQMWGYDANRTDLLYEDWYKIIHPEDTQRCLDAVEAARIHKHLYKVDYRIYRANDNALRWMRSVGQYHYNKQGEAISLTGISIDITDAKIAEEKLVASELRFRKLADQAPMWIWLSDKDVNILYANETLLNFLGIKHHTEFTGKTWESVVHPDDIKTVYDNLKQGATSKESVSYEIRAMNASTGKYEWVFLSVIALFEGEEFTGFIGTGVNMEEQKSMMSQLEYRTALLEAHNEASLDGILLVDTRGKIISYNHRFIEIWNMPDEIVQSRDDDAALAYATGQLVTPEKFIEKVKWLYENPEEISIDELEFIDGRIIERYGYPVKNPDGTYYAWSWMFRDITDQRMAARKIKESEERYHQLIVSSPSAIGVLLGEDLVVTTANDTIIEYWGKGKEIIGKKYFEALPELVEQGYKEVFAEVYKTGKPFSAIETPVSMTQNGEMKLRYYNFLLYPQRNVNGDIEGIGIIATEVTTQALFNKKIRESEANFRQLSELMPTKVSNADATGNVFYYNQSWLDYTGYSMEELMGDGWQKVMHPEELEFIKSTWTEAVRTGKEFEVEMRLRHKEGNYYWHLSRSTPVRDDQGQIVKWVGTNTEIQKIKEEEQRKSDFIKMVSHELKTPVTSIKGYVQLLLHMMDEEEQVELSAMPLKNSLNRIDKQVLRLTRLITEMLDLSRIETGKLDLKNERFSINDLVTESVQDIRHTSSVHKIEVQHDFKGYVMGDKDRIQQVLINFITNSIKYSPDNHNIEVRIFQPDEKHLSVSVKDYGIGINKEDHQKIFERFYRAEGKNGHNISGFGIGLFIANEIIQRHKGHITVESEEGIGSVFTFILPLSKAK